MVMESNTTVESTKSELREANDHGSPNVSLNGNSEVVEHHKTDFGENEGKKEEEVVEAINQHLAPPSRPTRRHKSPKAHPREIKPKPPLGEYPDDLNPFGDDEDEDTEEPSAAGTNPFGSDSEEEFDTTPMTSTPLTSPYKTPARPTPSASPGSDRRMSDFSPVRKAPSLNPFEDSDDELEEEKPAKPVPLPRKTPPSPEPRMPFPRSALRASQRSIASTVSTSSRKKRPAPPPPTPPSPSTTIRSTRSRKTRRAPLPPGMASSRLSLASDSISLGGFSVAESIDLPVQISAVTDRITEWVATSTLETSFDTTRSVADDSVTSRSFAETSTSDLQPSSPPPHVHSESDSSSHPKPCASPIPVIEIVDDSISSVNQDEVQNLKNECHNEEPKSITVTPSSSPIKIRDLSPSDEPLDNRIDPIIEIKADDNIENVESIDKLHHEKLMFEKENVKEIKDKRKSLTDSIGSDHMEHIIKRTESGGLTLTRLPKKHPAPRPLEPKVSITNRNSLTDSDVEDRLLNNKKNKDDVNMTRKISGSSTESSSGGFSLHKSAHGQWKRKKAPAPPLPLNPEQRMVKKDIPLLKIKQELNDIEIKQQGLERQGVALEARIRDKFDSDASITPYVEELVLQLFELVNEKNELFRKQAELMYLRRQQHLEEEQADLEKEIRALMGRPEANKTDSDKELEEQLIQRLVEVVERRDAIVQCLEMDRIREAEEDRSISAQLNVFTKAMAPEDKTATSPKKKKSHPEGNKKKWYTLGRSPKKTHS
uniref:BMERB domain-containing protein n=1 Tax=Lygus hesperus TaxID=30085 RepID=A0A0K8T9H2_LYGHE